MRVAALSLLTLTLGLAGCVSGLGSYDVVLDPGWASPDFRRIYLMEESGLPTPAGSESKGTVSGSFSQLRSATSSQRACYDLAETAIEELLLKAKELGANSIRELESRGRKGWLTRLVCRVRPGAYPFADPEVKMTLRGLAMHDPDLESARPLPKPAKDVAYERFLDECRAAAHSPRKPGSKKEKMCADLEVCLTGYSMALRPEAKRNAMCAERLRRGHRDFDAVIRAKD